MLPASQPNLVVAMNSYVDVAMPMFNEFSASARNSDYTFGNRCRSPVLELQRIDTMQQPMQNNMHASMFSAISNIQREPVSFSSSAIFTPPRILQTSVPMNDQHGRINMMGSANCDKP